MRRRWKRAWQRLAPSVLLLQSGLLVGAGFLLAAWVAIPDRNPSEITLSVLLAFGGVCAVLWSQSFLLIRVRRRPDAVSPWRGALVLALLVAVYMLFFSALDLTLLRLLPSGVDQSADAPSATNIGSLLLGIARTGLQAVVWLLLLPFGIEAAATATSGHWLRRSREVLRRRSFWLTGVAVCLFASAITSGLLLLRPDLPGAPSLLLGIAKTLTIAVVDVGALCFLLSFTSTYLRDAERRLGEQTAAPDAKVSVIQGEIDG